MDLKKFAIQFVSLVIIIFGALAFSAGKIPRLPSSPQSPNQAQVTINSTKINIEIADSPDKRKKGLGGRESLASDSGMLFIFEKPGKYGFWMKGLKFPLDLIWIRESKVVDIIRNATPLNLEEKDENLPIYMPKEPVDMVLEVMGGFADSHGIKFGDNIEILE